MDRQTAVRILRQHSDAIRQRGATALFLYGSTSRGRAGADSDVDLFVDYDPEGDFSLVELVALKEYLADVLQHDADVTTRDSLHPDLRDKIVKEAERVF